MLPPISYVKKVLAQVQKEVDSEIQKQGNVEKVADRGSKPGRENCCVDKSSAAFTELRLNQGMVENGMNEVVLQIGGGILSS